MNRLSGKLSVLIPVLVAAVILAYVPAFSGGFVWDDDDYVTHNPVLRNADGLRRIWFEPTSLPQYYPLVHTTFWIEFQLFELEPRAYHVTNVLLHALGSILLLFFLRRLELPFAFPATLVFALHPVHVESVAWITERKNLLSGVFSFLALLAWLRWRPLAGGDQEAGRTRWYWASLLAFVAALLGKTVACSLPAVLLLLIWWRRGRVRGKDVLATLPFFAVGAVMAFWTVSLEKTHVMAEGAAWDYTFVERCLIAGRALWFYVGKLCWPFGLAFNYPHFPVDAGMIGSWVFPAGVLAVLALALAGVRRWGRAPLTCMLVFCGTLLPALGFFNVYPMRYTYVADHYQYLPSLALLVPACGIWAMLRRRAGARGARLVLLAGCVIVAGLAVQTWRQAHAYESHEALWADTLEKEPGSWLALSNLGKLKLDAGHTREALKLLRDSLALRPINPEARTSLGVALVRLGEKAEARACFERAMRERPGFPDARNNLGWMLWQEGEVARAKELFHQTLEIAPHFVSAHRNLGFIAGDEGRHEDVVKHLVEVIAQAPEDTEARLRLGRSLSALGRHRQALGQLLRVLKVEPDTPGARVLAARSFAAVGEADAATRLLVTELSRDPDGEAAIEALADLLVAGFPVGSSVQLAEGVLQTGGRVPDSLSSLLEHLSDRLRRAGRRLEAAQVFQHLIARAQAAGRGAEAIVWQELLERLESQR